MLFEKIFNIINKRSESYSVALLHPLPRDR